MKRPRFTVRRMMILVAILAVLLVPILLYVKLRVALGEFYGPGGTLDRQNNPPATTPASALPSPPPSAGR